MAGYQTELKNCGPMREDWLSAIQSTREMTLSNLSMIAQIPAPSFNEKRRSEFLLERFAEAGISEPKTDELYNAIGTISPTRQDRQSRKILIATHMDNEFDEDIDQNISIRENRILGAGVAEDNLAPAVLATLPDIFRRAKLRHSSEINLLAATRSHGRGDSEGLKHYFNNAEQKPDYVIHISGTTFGQVDYFTLSRVRCDVRCRLNIEPEVSWVRTTHDSANVIANEVINSILSIPLARKPKSVLNVGMISGGERYSTVSREASIKLEFLSEDDSITDYVIDKINDYCIDIGAKHGVEVRADFFGRHHAVGLSCSHPLIKASIDIIRLLGASPIMEYSSSEITVPLSLGIPTVSLGLTTGITGDMPLAYVDIAPMNNGILQLLTLTYLIDRGCFDA